MVRRAALLSALTVTLLLGACSNKNEAESAASADAQAGADAPAAEAPAEESKPAPKMDYWRFVGPLIAGTYGGECMRLPDARKMDGAITIGADGKASAGGMDADFRTVKMAMLMRSRDDKGDYSALATLSVDDDKGGMLSLQAGKENGASLARGDTGIMCSKTTASNQLNAQPLYLALAKAVNGRKQTIGCLDTKNLLVRRNTDFEFADGVVRIGDESFDMKAAVSEGFTVHDGGETVALAVVMPEERTLNAMFDGAGKLTHVQAHKKQESTYFCDVKS